MVIQVFLPKATPTTLHFPLSILPRYLAISLATVTLLGYNSPNSYDAMASPWMLQSHIYQSSTELLLLSFFFSLTGNMMLNIQA